MAGPHIIVDTSIWIDHINQGHAELAAQLRRRRVLIHPMVVGEVALGSISNRQAVLEELRAMPQALAASHGEVMAMIEWLKLHETRIGYVDVHLLAAARQAEDGQLWTRDKALHKQAVRLGVAYVP